MQSLQTFVDTHWDNPNPVAFYYLAMSYVKVGDKEKALEMYNNVLWSSQDDKLKDFAEKGKVCIEDPEACYIHQKVEEEVTEVDQIVTQKYIKGLSESVTKDLDAKNLERLRREIEAGADVNRNEFMQYPVFNKRSQGENEDGIKISFNDMQMTNSASLEQSASEPVYVQPVAHKVMPTNDEIVEALRVLNDAGFVNLVNQMTVPLGNNFAPWQQNGGETPQQFNDILRMLGNQNLNGQNGMNAQNIPPELLQMMLTNSMSPDLNFGGGF